MTSATPTLRSLPVSQEIQMREPVRSLSEMKGIAFGRTLCRKASCPFFPSGASIAIWLPRLGGPSCPAVFSGGATSRAVISTKAIGGEFEGSFGSKLIGGDGRSTLLQISILPFDCRTGVGKTIQPDGLTVVWHRDKIDSTVSFKA